MAGALRGNTKKSKPYAKPWMELKDGKQSFDLYKNLKIG
jgi:hypothetical protein